MCAYFSATLLKEAVFGGESSFALSYTVQIIGSRADVLRISPEPKSRSLVVIFGDAVKEHLSVHVYFIVLHV